MPALLLPRWRRRLLVVGGLYLLTVVAAFSWYRPDGCLTAGFRAGYLFYGESTYPVYYNSRFGRGGAEVLWLPWPHVQTRRMAIPTIFWNPRQSRSTAPETAYITAPLWTPAALLLGLLALNDWRRSRVIRGGCGNCGYSRAGIAVDAKCPECGWVPRTSGECVYPPIS